MTNTDSNRDVLYSNRIITNVACVCGHVYQYRDWEDDEKKCPQCERVQ